MQQKPSSKHDKRILADDSPEKTMDCYIGERIQAIRRVKKVTQKALLRQLSNTVTQQQLSRYERGISPIPSKLLFEISNILGVTTETFMPVKSDRQKHTCLSLPSLDKAIEAALTSFNEVASVTTDEIKQLEKLLRYFYKR